MSKGGITHHQAEGEHEGKRAVLHNPYVMGLDAQEAGGSLVHVEGAQVSKT